MAEGGASARVPALYQSTLTDAARDSNCSNMAEADMCLQNGGYDVELFVDVPDDDLICSICQGVLRCPVRAACHHVFCKKCIMQWLKRQETCPCCRKPVNQSLIFVMFKLSKAIGRLKVKCRNEIRGCQATFPLSEQYCHSMGCLFELISCPYQGCRAQLLRRDLQAHTQHCEHWKQPCHMGCGAMLSQRTRSQHNCYQDLRRQYEAKQQTHRAIATALQRKMRKMQNTMAHMKRQVSLICESLEVMDDVEELDEAEEATENSAEANNS